MNQITRRTLHFDESAPKGLCAGPACSTCTDLPLAFSGDTAGLQQKIHTEVLPWVSGAGSGSGYGWTIGIRSGHPSVSRL